MRLAASGTVFDTSAAPVNQRSASHPAALLAADGTLLVSCRLGTERESGDGHAALLASRDRGETWEMRHLGLADRWLDGVRGETRSFTLAELEPGVVTASVLWTDRSDPDRPWVHPETQGLLPMRNYHTSSRDGGLRWDAPRPIDLALHPSASTTGPLLRLANGALAQPFEHWKAYDDPAPGVPRAMLRLSRDGGASWMEDVVVAADPRNRTWFWDQRLASHPETGELVAMFWTFDAVAGRDLAIHIAWGSPDGRRWTPPQPTPLDGQHCQPISIAGAPGAGPGSIVAAYTHRRDPPGIRVARSDDFGRSWATDGELEVYRSGAGTEPAATGGSQADYWNAMGAWQFGHPRGVAMPDGDVFVTFYGGSGTARSARWARVEV